MYFPSIPDQAKACRIIFKMAGHSVPTAEREEKWVNAVQNDPVRPSTASVTISSSSILRTRLEATEEQVSQTLTMARLPNALFEERCGYLDSGFDSPLCLSDCGR